MDVQGKILALFGRRDTSLDFFDQRYSEDACRAGGGSAEALIAVGTTGESVSVEAIFNGCGYMHLFRNNEGKLRELGTYAILKPTISDMRRASVTSRSTRSR